MTKAPGLSWLRLRGLILTFVAASFWPLQVVAVNGGGVSRPERVFLIIAAAWAASLLVIAILVAVSIPVEPAENTSFIALVMLMSAGPIMRRSESLVYLLLVLLVFACWLFVRLQGRPLVAGLVWGTAVALAVGPVTAFVDSWGLTPASFQEEEPLRVDMTATPDIFVVVFDGYPGLKAADLDGLSTGEVDVVSELRSQGFEIPASSWASYWVSSLSIPSMLQLAYPLEAAEWSESSVVDEAQRVLSGDSNLVGTLDSAGYETHMVESGWSFASCGNPFDQCVPAPWINEATYLILRHTMAWGLIEESPGPFTEGALAVFDWLLANGREISESPTPDFVFAHVLAPHPPFFLTSDCSAEVTPERGGTFFDISGVSIEAREAYLVEQMDCVDSFMVSFAKEIETDDVIIYVSDHGTDRRDQTSIESSDWDRDAIIERMNNLLAIRMPEDCSIGDEVVLPNLFRLVLACFSSSPIDTLPERMWLNPMHEVDRFVVEDLVSEAPKQ